MMTPSSGSSGSGWDTAPNNNNNLEGGGGGATRTNVGLVVASRSHDSTTEKRRRKEHCGCWRYARAFGWVGMVEQYIVVVVWVLQSTDRNVPGIVQRSKRRCVHIPYPVTNSSPM